MYYLCSVLGLKNNCKKYIVYELHYYTSGVNGMV